VTAAVLAGAPPFVLAGTDDGPVGWLPTGGVDPQAMLSEELPEWLGARGYAAHRRGLWGWSRGGYGALRYVQEQPSWASALALFSPALHSDDPALANLSALGAVPWALWCGRQDPFHDGAVALADEAPTAPDPWVQGDGGHTRIYWNDHTVDMMRFLAGRL
jgi:dienelactone hydrolase